LFFVIFVSFESFVAVPSAVTAQSAAPPLPRLALDTYPPAAREDISKAHAEASAHPDDPNAVGTLARMLEAWEQWDAAHEAYLRAQALAPKAFDWHYLDAIVLQRVARPADAAADLREALAITPDYLPARVKLAEALLDAGQLEESRTLFLAIHDPAAEPSVELGLGRIEAATGHHEAAIPHFQKAIALYPEFGTAHYALALSYRALGRRDEARAELEAHAKHGAKWPAIPDPVFASVAGLREDAGALLQRGIKLANAGQLDAAIAAHEAALVADPSYAQAHANLISLYGRTGNYAKAEEHYRAAVAAGASLADAHYDYGVLLGMQQKWDESAEAYRQALAVNPLHARARNNLGQILERERKYEEAAAEYRRAVESQPTLRIARFNYARMLIALGRNEEAIAELQQLTEPRDAEAPRYLFALSAAYFRTGNKQQAVKWATDARQLALQFGDHDLAAAIDRNLAAIR
jgi:tetratricopeptide (TPR) repeat protein